MAFPNIKMYLFNPQYQSQRQFIDSIPSLLEQQGTTIKATRNLIKVLQMPDGTHVNVKRYHAPRYANKLVYSTGLRRPKGQRAYEYAMRLCERGIETPEPIAYIEERTAGILGLSYFISIQCNYGHTFYEWGDAPEGSYEEIALAFAAFTANMHNQRVLHLDYSPGNILWERIGEDYHFSVVDINRMYFGKVDLARGCANFARLWGPKRFIQLIVREYARLRGFDADEAERLAMDARTAFWQRFSKRHKVKFHLEL